MGRLKQYQFNIKQYIHSIEHKTKYYYLKAINIQRYGLCLVEAELLANIANNLYQHHLLKIPEFSFQMTAYKKIITNKKQSLNELCKKTVSIPAFSHFELEFYSKYGLNALQNYRILNILDSLTYQDAMIDINRLAKIVNINPKSIRKRLNPFLKEGIKLPLIYVSNKSKKETNKYRYSIALYNFFIENKDEQEIFKQLYISKNEWNNLLFYFFQFAYGKIIDFIPFQCIFIDIAPKIKSYTQTPRFYKYAKLFPPINDSNKKDPKEMFLNILKTYFSFSNALIYDYIKFLEHEAHVSNKQRLSGEIIYYALNDTVSPGTPLVKSETTPIKLMIWAEDDLYPYSPYHTALRKWNKVLRYSIQAQQQKTTLSQYDLAFLLGVSVAVIKNLMKKNNHVLLPTRGNIQDIGPGITHAEKIIKLYLEGYSETEIKFKTHHSYESIENYLKNFTKVVGLTDLGFNLNQIRMTAKITLNLAKRFLEIYHQYNIPEYNWMLTMIRNRFHGRIKKNLNLGDSEQ